MGRYVVKRNGGLFLNIHAVIKDHADGVIGLPGMIFRTFIDISNSKFTGGIARGVECITADGEVKLEEDFENSFENEKDLQDLIVSIKSSDGFVKDLVKDLDDFPKSRSITLQSITLSVSSWKKWFNTVSHLPADDICHLAVENGFCIYAEIYELMSGKK